jgi:hypothetical protein
MRHTSTHIIRIGWKGHNGTASAKNWGKYWQHWMLSSHSSRKNHRLCLASKKASPLFYNQNITQASIRETGITVWLKIIIHTAVIFLRTFLNRCETFIILTDLCIPFSSFSVKTDSQWEWIVLLLIDCVWPGDLYLTVTLVQAAYNA